MLRAELTAKARKEADELVADAPASRSPRRSEGASPSCAPRWPTWPSTAAGPAS